MSTLQFPVNIFYYSAPEDIDLSRKFDTHLSTLKQQKIIQVRLFAYDFHNFSSSNFFFYFLEHRDRRI